MSAKLFYMDNNADSFLHIILFFDREISKAIMHWHV